MSFANVLAVANPCTCCRFTAARHLQQRIVSGDGGGGEGEANTSSSLVPLQAPAAFFCPLCEFDGGGVDSCCKHLSAFFNYLII